MKKEDLLKLMVGIIEATNDEDNDNDNEESENTRLAQIDFPSVDAALEHAKKILCLHRGDKVIIRQENGDVKALFVDIVSEDGMALARLLSYNEKDKCYQSATVGRLGSIELA